MKSTMKKDYLWNTIGVFAQNAISPLLLIAITRVNGIDGSGLFSFAFSLAIIFWTLGMWGGRTYQVSDTKSEFSQQSYVMVRVVLSIVMLVGALLFSIVNQYDVMKTAIILALVLFKVIESISDAIYGVLQVHGKLYVVGKSLLYKALFGFTAFLVVDIWTSSILLGSLAIVAANVLVFVLYDLRLTKKEEHLAIPFSQITLYVKRAIAIMKQCAPVFAVAFLIVFSLNIPRYFIDVYAENEIAYFGILAMPITLIALVMSFILQPNIVGLAGLYAHKKYQEFNTIVVRIIGITIGIGFAVFVIAFLIGIPALQLVFNVDFSDYKDALMVMIAGGIVNAIVSVFINILVVMRHFKAQFYILLGTNVALAIAAFVTVQMYGLLGGIYLFTITNVLQVILLALAYSGLLRKKRHTSTSLSSLLE